MPRTPILLAVALLVAVAPSAWGATFTVTTSGLTFDPDTLTVHLGDTVEWVWAIGTHTVTSGIDLDDPNAGALFDAPLSSANPSFSYTFSDTVGTYPYFCRPHVLFGMKGVIFVESAQVGVPEWRSGEEITWSRLKQVFR